MNRNEQQNDELTYGQQRWLSIADREQRILSSHLSVYDEITFSSSSSLSFGASSSANGTEQEGGSRIPRGWGSTRDFSHDIIPVDPAILAQEFGGSATEEEANTILHVISKPMQAISKPITTLLVQPVFQFCTTSMIISDEADKMEVVGYIPRLAEEDESVDDDDEERDAHERNFLLDLPKRFLQSAKGSETRDGPDTSEKVETSILQSNGGRRVLFRVPNFRAEEGAVKSDGGRVLLAISKRCMPWQDDCTRPPVPACEDGNIPFASLGKANAFLSERLKNTKSFCMLKTLPSVPRLWQREPVE
eukprot:CAMPEP_0119009872 /NCGR_PEP_ID=MMETSP1176-20130426/4648_1 /TAXON_ID=265551 /ORGANISM="Synedropsis recta cf, Strain CCMP1620" /LENGTH=304 /DNA_ID=CAMNT_0006962453 /DNA_START=251 /DNA_END=1165 /DNA_ORIENTATION=+